MIKSLILSICLIFVVFASESFCAISKVDSLKALIKNDIEDAQYVDHLAQLADIYIKQKKYFEAEKVLNTSLSASERIRDPKLLIEVQNRIIDFYDRTSQYKKGLEILKKFELVRDSIDGQISQATFEKKLSTVEAQNLIDRKKSYTVLIILFILVFILLILCISFYRKLKKYRIERDSLKVGNDEIRIVSSELNKVNHLLKSQEQIVSEYPLIVSEREQLQILIEQMKVTSVDQLKTIESKDRLLEKYLPLIDIDSKLNEEGKKYEELKIDYENSLVKFNQLSKELNLLEESIENIDYGFYKPHFFFKSSTDFKVELEKITDSQKELIKKGEAVLCNVEWSIGSNKAEGKKMIQNMSKLMLKAFNGESDSSIAKVSWNNIVTMEARVTKAFETINKFGAPMQVSISNEYKELKLKELFLNFELEEKLYKEKEEQRRIKEQMRDEEKAARELEKEMKETHDEEVRYEKAIEKARQEVNEAKGAELDELNEKIKLLEEKLLLAKEKERAISMAQRTKSGYVYIISNIGSFGENVYKIGMTRRLDPQERVNELGDASVPFDFDVHGLIYSDNAPDLEARLHSRFEFQRLNLVNYRTEFFKVSLDEIESVVNELSLNVQLTRIAVAKEYRETISLIKAKEDDKTYSKAYNNPN